jgi:maltose-binding protein MalE
MRRLCVRRWQYALCCWSFLACALTVPAVAPEIGLKAWTIGPDDHLFLRQATGLLRYARFAPNHPDWSQYEAIVTEAIRAVQARRLAPPEAARFVTMRLRQQLHNQVRIVE